MTEVSIVIPTFNRDEDLKDLLCSILGQSKIPREVIVVDDSVNNKTRDLIEQMRNDFSNKEITLRYMRGGSKKTKSISRARNLGAAQSTARVIIFIDDDIRLDREYIKEILKIYEENPNALGVGGYITNSREHISSVRSFLANLICKIFFRFHREKDGCRVLRSGHVTYPYSINGVIKCEWLSGTNSSYKREVLKNFQWDENLKGFSLFDDVDISYRIHKRYPTSLYMTPHAKVVHKASPSARIDVRRLIYLEATYHTYFFFKNVRQTLLNRIIFLWSIIGRFLTTYFFVCAKKRPGLIVSVIDIYRYILNHLDEVKNGIFSDFSPMFRARISTEDK